MIGLWVQAWDYDKKQWGPLYRVLCEFDESVHNPWKGMILNNARRNKFFGHRMESMVPELLVIDKWDHSIRFFEHRPNTDWSIIVPDEH